MTLLLAFVFLFLYVGFVYVVSHTVGNLVERYQYRKIMRKKAQDAYNEETTDAYWAAIRKMWKEADERYKAEKWSDGSETYKVGEGKSE